ncbi:hypothetical protein YB2330_001149 [Saitoella coloradoensis]
MSASLSKSAFYRRHIRSASLSLGKPVISPARHSTSSVISASIQHSPAPGCGTPTRHRRNASAFSTFSVKQMLFSTAAASNVSQEQLSSHTASLISDAAEMPTEGAPAKPMETAKEPQTLNLGPTHPMYRLHLLVGCITSTTPHATAPHLWVHTIRLSSSATCERTILSGLKRFYPNGDEMTGKKVVVVANLPAKKLRGIKSEGMILCGVREDERGEVVRLLEPPHEARVGERVVVEGMVLPGIAQIHAVEAAETASEKIPAAAPLPPKVLGKKETVWEEIVGGFTVGNDSLGRWDGRKLYVEGKGECFCPGVEGGKIC